MLSSIVIDVADAEKLVPLTVKSPSTTRSSVLVVPVNTGPASGAFRLRAVVAAVDNGLFSSEVLSTFPRPTCSFVTPATVPVKVGESMFAFRSRPSCT
jgi:hypothetical protein